MFTDHYLKSINQSCLCTRRNPDAYHTNYNLVGLSSAQNHFIYKASTNEDSSTSPSSFNWSSTIKSPMAGDKQISGEIGLRDSTQIFNEGDRVLTIHPVFVVPAGSAEAMHSYFASKPLT